MSFLKKLGSILLKATEIVSGYGPLFTKVVPGSDKVIPIVLSELQQLESIIVTIEVAGQALNIPGPDKLKAASPLVAQVILQSSLMAGKEIADPLLFQKGCTSIGSGMADVLNSFKDKVETVNKA